MGNGRGCEREGEGEGEGKKAVSLSYTPTLSLSLLWARRALLPRSECSLRVRNALQHDTRAQYLSGVRTFLEKGSDGRGGQAGYNGRGGEMKKVREKEEEGKRESQSKQEGADMRVRVRGTEKASLTRGIHRGREK